VELEHSRALLEKNGVKIAAVSYDSQEILSAFAQEYSIGYPLLSDKGSEVIRQFGIFNFNMAPGLRSYGVPHPVEYLISPDGVVAHKYFVPNYQHRVTASAVALREFGEVSPEAPVVALESGPLSVRVGFPTGRAFAGQEVSFFARFTLEPGWHIYGSPAPQDLTVTSIVFEDSAVMSQEVAWPEPPIVEFPSLNQRVPAYGGSVEALGKLLLKFPLPEGALTLHGRLCFQLCGENWCEPPQAVSFELPLTLDRFVISDRERKLSEQKGAKS
jgi:hypothetical protein